MNKGYRLGTIETYLNSSIVCPVKRTEWLDLHMTSRAFFNHFLNLGTHHYADPVDKTRVKVVNLMYYCFWLIVMPSGLIISFQSTNRGEEWLILFSALVSIPLFGLNIRAKAEWSFILFQSLTIISSVLGVLVIGSSVQSPAPYYNLVMGFGSLYFIRNKLTGHILAALSFITFLVLHAYQLVHLEFSLNPFFAVVPMPFLAYLIFYLLDRDNRNYKNELMLKNRTIARQSVELLELEKEKNAKMLEFKQRDLETALTQNSLQIKFRNQLVGKLEEIKRGKRQPENIGKLVLELRNQIKSFEKFNELGTNMEVINAQMYDRLVKHHPQLSKAETEICAFLKLGLSSKEIAAIRGTTENTINVLKTRIRDKMGLETNAHIRPYLLTL